MYQLRRGLEKLGLTVDLSKVDYEEDTLHFTAEQEPRLLPTVDLILLGREGKRFVGFPVHGAVIAVHSPILDRAVHDLYDDKASQLTQLPRLPMTEDSCPAIRAALAGMYHCHAPSENDSRHSMEVDDIVASCELLELCHKYDMDSIMRQHEAMLLDPLYRHLNKMQSPSTLTNVKKMAVLLPTVTTMIVIVEKCGLKALLTICEAFMIVHFEIHHLAIKDALEAQASGNSMYKIAEFFQKHYKVKPSKDLTMETACNDISRDILRSYSRNLMWARVCPGMVTKLLWLIHDS